MENRLHRESGRALEYVVESNEMDAACAAVIPCLNEEESVGAVVEGTRRYVGKVWVIDDGSSDGTSAEAERAGAVVIRNKGNLGKGAALREGLAAAHAEGFQFAVALDGDGQHDPAEIPKLLGAVESGADLAIGNRMEAAAEMTWVRRIVNRWMSKRLEKRLGIECLDSQCGFRAIRLEAWAGLTLRQNRFEVESEMLASFARAGLKIAFVPVRSLPARRRSRIRPVIDSARWLRWWFATK
jgi:glycosyltransferase involved in cell wall biosynthesis